MKPLLVLMLAASALCAAPGLTAPDPAVVGSVTVFVQPGVSDVAKDFEATHLPALRKIAADYDMPLEVRTTEEGVPAEVGLTPMIVYQNYLGRSLFQGRYAAHGRVRNFLRTSRHVPQGAVDLHRENVPVWDLGRMTVSARVKVVDLAGTHPDDFEAKVFMQEGEAATPAGWHRFQMTPELSVGRSDRVFYLDFYPWRSESGELHLTGAVFSQFHCEEPIFDRRKEAWVGSWEQRDKVFAAAARDMERAIEAHMGETILGDGFDPVPQGTAVVTWKDLGMALPEAPVLVPVETPQLKTVPNSWTIAEVDPSDVPMVQFRFPAPLDHYSGVVEGVSGELHWDGGGPGGKGWVEAAIQSLSMGDDELNATLHAESFFHLAQFPTARFDLQSLALEGPALSYGAQCPGSISGQYQMRGVTIPLHLRSTFELFVNDIGEPRLLVNGAFELRLKEPFGMLGADGPRPQSDTVIVTLNVVFKPAERHSQQGE